MSEYFESDSRWRAGHANKIDKDQSLAAYRGDIALGGDVLVNQAKLLEQMSEEIAKTVAEYCGFLHDEGPDVARQQYIAVHRAIMCGDFDELKKLNEKHEAIGNDGWLRTFQALAHIGLNLSHVTLLSHAHEVEGGEEWQDRMHEKGDDEAGADGEDVL